jgi:hypothetical protein
VDVCPGLEGGVRTYLFDVEAGADVDEDFVAVGELGGDVEGASEGDEEVGVWVLISGREGDRVWLGDGLGWLDCSNWLLFLFLSSCPCLTLRLDSKPLPTPPCMCT